MIIQTNEEKQMGLDFSHCDAHWSYSGFNRFRNNLVVALGYTTSLDEMYENGSYADKLKHESIFPLIDHSDCEGYLTVKEMSRVVNQLKYILEIWENNFEMVEYHYDIRQGRCLIEGMEEAIEADESIEFR